MNRQKMMALVAHDNMKHDLAEWVDWNCEKLSKHRIVCTGTTGKIVEETPSITRLPTTTSNRHSTSRG